MKAAGYLVSFLIMHTHMVAFAIRIFGTRISGSTSLDTLSQILRMEYVSE